MVGDDAGPRVLPTTPVRHAVHGVPRPAAINGVTGLTPLTQEVPQRTVLPPVLDEVVRDVVLAGYKTLLRHVDHVEVVSAGMDVHLLLVTLDLLPPSELEKPVQCRDPHPHHFAQQRIAHKLEAGAMQLGEFLEDHDDPLVHVEVEEPLCLNLKKNDS